MFTIREREIGLHNGPEEVEEPSEESSRYVLNDEVVSIEDGSSDSDEVNSVMDGPMARDDVLSEVDLREAFVMGSDARKAGGRRRRILAKVPKMQGTITQNAGLLGLSIDNGGKVSCYGAFPGSNEFSVNFESPTHFLVWLLQKVINYKKDARSQSQFVNIFTLGGSTHELPVILNAFVSVVGRDVHFIGDPCKPLMVWYENIRFFDLLRYFEGRDLRYFTQKWAKSKGDKPA